MAANITPGEVLVNVYDEVAQQLRTSASLSVSGGLSATVTIPQPLAVSGTITANPHAVFQTAGPWAVSGAVTNAVLTDVWDNINHGFRTSLINTPDVKQAGGPWAVSGTVSVGTPNVGQTAGPWAVSGTITTSPHAVFQTAGPWAVSGSVGGYTAVASGSFLRPTGTNTYTTNTGVANATGSATYITLSNAARVGGPGTGVILGAIMTDYANQTLKGTFELWVFSTAPASPVADNSSWAPSAVDLQSLVGVVSFSTSFVGNSGSGAAGNVVFIGTLTPNPMTYRIASGTSLFGMLCVRNAYIPVNLEAFSFQLQVSLD